jgi:hypothetical protein
MCNFSIADSLWISILRFDDWWNSNIKSACWITSICVTSFIHFMVFSRVNWSVVMFQWMVFSHVIQFVMSSISPDGQVSSIWSILPMWPNAHSFGKFWYFVIHHSIQLCDYLPSYCDPSFPNLSILLQFHPWILVGESEVHTIRIQNQISSMCVVNNFIHVTCSLNKKTL